MNPIAFRKHMLQLDALFWVFISFALLANIGDYVSTYWALGHGAIEVNPFAAPIFFTWYWAMIKLLLVPMGYIVGGLVIHRFVGFGRSLAAMMFLATFALVDVWNLITTVGMAL